MGVKLVGDEARQGGVGQQFDFQQHTAVLRLVLKNTSGEHVDRFPRFGAVVLEIKCVLKFRIHNFDWGGTINTCYSFEPLVFPLVHLPGTNRTAQAMGLPTFSWYMD
jgi:hypothetical protein